MPDPRPSGPTSAPVPDAARELERMLVRRRAIDRELLTLDAFSRWGPKDEGEQAEARANGDRLAAEERAIDAELEARVKQLRAEHPEAVEAWASAHQRLLDHFLDGLTDAQPTERSVAEKERAAWRRVAGGKKAFVDQNTYFVRYDEALFEALFGRLVDD